MFSFAFEFIVSLVACACSLGTSKEGIANDERNENKLFMCL